MFSYVYNWLDCVYSWECEWEWNENYKQNMCESIMNKNEVVLTFYDEDCLEKKK